jgi:hypothetical protein
VIINMDLQSVKNAVLLWEPKPDKRRPGEVTRFTFSSRILHLFLYYYHTHLQFKTCPAIFSVSEH